MAELFSEPIPTPKNRKKKTPRSTGSLRGAINKMCRQCIVDPCAAGSGIVQIELCPAFDCPLWPVRPVRSNASRETVGYSNRVLETYGVSEDLAAHLLKHPRKRP